MNRKLPHYVLIFTLFISSVAVAQQPVNSNYLFTAGHAGAFIGGLYDGFYPYSKLKQHGNFGLGAPDKLDGELLMLDGHIYQTQAGGKTFEVNDNGLTPFAIVNFFHAGKMHRTSQRMSKEKLYAYLDSLLPNGNGLYAIRITGSFKSVKTRAFPPVTQTPYVPLAQMLPLQHFFNFTASSGTLVGYRIPAYLEGANITGYHFHYLTSDKQGGGHLIDLLTGSITVEIDELNGFTLDLPQTAAFRNFDFKKDRREEVKQVENGKKN